MRTIAIALMLGACWTGAAPPMTAPTARVRRPTPTCAALIEMIGDLPEEVTFENMETCDKVDEGWQDWCKYGLYLNYSIDLRAWVDLAISRCMS